MHGDHGERRRRRATAWLAVTGAALLGPAAVGPVPAAAAADQAAAFRYALAGGCYALKSRSTGRFVARAGDGYAATAETLGAAEPFRLQATALARYLLFGRSADFLAAGTGDRAQPAPQPSDAAEFRAQEAGGALRFAVTSSGRHLGVGDGGALVLTAGDGDATLFTAEQAADCAVYPEAEINAEGAPAKGRTPYGEVRGLLDAHLHMMAFEFLGGRARCGRPWHRFGITHALVDCPDHEPGGAGGLLENVLSSGNPFDTHDTVGWPTFKDWPAHRSLTHEQVYYKWLERAWRGGLRMFVNLLVDNAVLCEVYPYKRNSCNEMDGVRLQAVRIHELQDYIDAQNGGPGKGWFRIVKDPFEARRVINDGKLAVVLGIETSKLFDCGVYNDVPDRGCDRAHIDRQLAEIHRLGVRQMELVNKFDNALAGVAGDGGITGVLTNTGNRYETGRFLQMQTCDGHNHAHVADKTQIAPPGGVADRDALAGGIIQSFLPGATSTLPVYPSAPHCNQRGLSELGEHLIKGMIARGMIFDPDHMSVLARNQALSVVEAADYSGIVSSHTWSTPDAYPRIYRLGGVITPYAGDAENFVDAWRKTKPERDPRFYFGFGYGADTNGFGGQGGARPGPNPVTYPFKSFDGKVTFHRQRSGSRVFDITKDGVAHYGLYPDWIEDLRRLAGDEIVEDMARGPEAYLQMWERAVGIRPQACRPPRTAFARRGLGVVRLGDDADTLLRRAGQPAARPGRTWRYCVRGKANAKAKVVGVFTGAGRVGLVASTARGHRSLRIGPGARAGLLRGKATPFGRGVRVRRVGRGKTRIVYGVRRGRVRFVAVAAPSVVASRARLAQYLRRAGVR